MTEERIDWQSFVGLTLLVIAFILLGLWTADAFFGPTPEAEDNFKVVDKYRGCDVIRYSPNLSAKYYYFLDCGK